jgi:three-Cys-motif partner protein
MHKKYVMKAKGRKKKTSYDRLKDQLLPLTFASDDTIYIFNILKKNKLWINQHDVEYGPHTLLKLACLRYYFDIALEVAKNYFENYIFIDAFAGSGLVKIKGTNYVSLGSSLLALTFKSRTGIHFKKVICVEKDMSRAKLLENRLKILKKEFNLDTYFKVFPCDVNLYVEKVSEEINAKDYGILFIDPEGVEINLPNLKIVLSKSDTIDVILNQSRGVYRLVGKAEKGDKNALKKLNEYLGIKEIIDPNKATDELFKLFGKPINAIAQIRDENNKLLYTLSFRVRNTKGGSRWMKAMEDFITNVINKYNGSDVKRILDQIHGKNLRIDDFIEK